MKCKFDTFSAVSFEWSSVSHKYANEEEKKHKVSFDGIV
jgi:hypothetical protein